MPSSNINATLPLVPRVGACGGADLAANPGICVPQKEACPTNDRFTTKAVGFCSKAEKYGNDGVGGAGRGDFGSEGHQFRTCEVGGWV